MSDLISRSAAKEEILSWAVCINKPNLLSRDDAMTVLDLIPAVDAVPVVHGRWELYPSSMHRRCSVCKMEYEKPKFNVRANYCPNCGAKMDKNENP